MTLLMGQVLELKVFQTAVLLALLSVIAPSASGAPSKVITVDGKQIKAMALSPDGTTVALSVYGFQRGGLVDSGVEIWDLRSGKRGRVLQQQPWIDGQERNSGEYVVGSLEFSPDGKLLTATDGQGFVLWNLDSGVEKFRWQSGTTDPALSAAWSPNGELLALPSMEQERFALTNGIAIINANTGKRVAFFPVEGGYARTARFSPDGRLLVTAGQDCTVRVFDVKTAASVFEDSLQTTLFAAAFSPDGQRIVAGSSWAGVLLLYDVTWENGKPICQKKGKSAETREEIHSVEFTPDGRKAFTSSHAGVRLWEKDWVRSQRIDNCKGRLSVDGKHFALVRETTPNVLEVWNTKDFASASRAEPLQRH